MSSLFLLLYSSCHLNAQEPGFTLNVNVDLVELQVTVLDAQDKHVPNLTRIDFQVFEDRIPQQIKVFRHGDRPVSLGLVIDNSRSMERKKDKIDTAVLSFVQLSNPEDEAFLLQFDDTVRLVRDFTTNLGVLRDGLASMSPYGQTALYDAIVEGLTKMEEGIYDRKAILLVTDGSDNASAKGFENLLEKARSTEVSIYPIGVLNESTDGNTARRALLQIAKESGGRAFFPQHEDDIPSITQRIARELRELYTLAYEPSNARRDGTWRSVRVEVLNPSSIPRYRTNYRHGYYAPGPRNN